MIYFSSYTTTTIHSFLTSLGNKKKKKKKKNKKTRCTIALLVYICTSLVANMCFAQLMCKLMWLIFGFGLAKFGAHAILHTQM